MPSQEAIAIYRNPWGQVVIRAEKADDGVHVFIRISPEHLPAVIRRSTEILKESAGGGNLRRD